MSKTTAGQSESTRPISSLAVLGARVTWLGLAPMLLGLTTIGIVQYGQGWTTIVDAIFAVLVVLMVLGRWVEMRSEVATTVMGDPATWGHFRRFVIVLIPSALAVWIMANLVGNSSIE